LEGRLSRILTISAGDYFAMAHNPAKYKPVGLHVIAPVGKGCRSLFAMQIPDGVEVVVAFREYIVRKWYFASGTALFPKG